MKNILTLLLVIVTFGCFKKDTKHENMAVVDPEKQLQFFLTEYGKSGEVKTSIFYTVPAYKK